MSFLLVEDTDDLQVFLDHGLGCAASSLGRQQGQKLLAQLNTTPQKIEEDSLGYDLHAPPVMIPPAMIPPAMIPPDMIPPDMIPPDMLHPSRGFPKLRNFKEPSSLIPCFFQGPAVWWPGTA